MRTISCKLLGLLVAGIAVSAGLSACGPTATVTFGDSAVQAATTYHWTIFIFNGKEDIQGPDGTGHAAFVPSSIVVKQGELTTISFVNKDSVAHTMTSPDLGINIAIAAGQPNGDGSVNAATTTANITPIKTGVYRWYCAAPCDLDQRNWAMSADWSGPDKMGYMAGYIVVV